MSMTQDQTDAAMNAYARGWRCPPGKEYFLAHLELSGTLHMLDDMSEAEWLELVS